MLHELFLALSGLESSFLCTSKRNDLNGTSDNIEHLANHTTKCDRDGTEEHISDPKFSFSIRKIIGGASYFHPCEVKIIEEILQVGEFYKKILIFKENVFKCTFGTNSKYNEDVFKPGHYLTTLATAILEETKDYQKKIIQLESQYLENPQLLLSTILLDVKPFYFVFVELCAIIDEVKKQKLHGCRILDYLDKSVLLSVGEIQSVLKRIKFSVQKILAEQLTYWLLYGELLDPHEELFVKVQKCDLSEQMQSSKSSDALLSGTQNKQDIRVSLVLELLPEFIPLSTADKIVFIGESILCFGKEEGKKDGMCLKRGLKSRDDEKHLMDKFVALAQLDSSSVSMFLDLIEEERTNVAKHLHNLVMESGLDQTLSCMKDIFLLGRGELYHAFYTLIENIEPNVFNINALFHKAGRQILMDESFLEKLRVTCDESSLSLCRLNVWRNLRVDYKIDWPLHKFFSANIMKKYNSILTFLLDIRQTQLRLQDLWISQKQNKTTQSGRFDLLCLTLRHHMGLLIYNIQYYIEVDVLESQFNELKKNLRSVQDYQLMCFHHESFLASITAQCFLSHPFISKLISLILEKVNSFCTLLNAPPSTPDLAARINGLKEDFDGASAKFFWALKTLCQSRNGRFTAQLVMRIDYNKFYTYEKNGN